MSSSFAPLSTPEGAGSVSGAQNHPAGCMTRPLTIPVLGIGGAERWAEATGEGMKPAANDAWLSRLR
ncbi:MAG TPA: hypothetical protein VFR23_09550 [Jiangellaceae bacterium]|nr:hypothetical protein [Jiangellaceae bacterium]